MPKSKKVKVSLRVLRARAAQRLAAKKIKKAKPNLGRPQVGTHLDRNPHLNPKRPQPREIGERRGCGKPPIRVQTLNDIHYRLYPTGKVLVHHETCGHTINLQAANTFIREWIGLGQDDYCEIVKVVHTFTHDIPTLKVEAL